MPNETWPEGLWHGPGAGARVARSVLWPFSLAYGAVVATRGRLYDRGLFATRDTAIPCVSIGNLTVGGTGKTPIAAWFAHQLAGRGARPAVILRGYGDDEPLVHAVLNPAVPVIVGRDRVEGAARARDQGCDVAVLDDAFQHRQARRVIDVVLVSADRFGTTRQLLPAGPYREPLHALRRADLVMVTRKAASGEEGIRVARELREVAPKLASCVIHLAPGALRQLQSEETLGAEALMDREVLAIAAIADARAFVRQLTSLGARVTVRHFRDHHRFTREEVERLVRESAGFAMTVCTLKDAVKLTPIWPRVATPFWYVSQHLTLEEGGSAVDAVLQRLLDARPSAHPSNAG